ncbi:MAG: ABC transporter ATP-binding protein [Thermodesulfobacteriota bacterium]
MALLQVRDLNKRFGGLHAVNSVSFDVQKGAIKSVIGPNGAGKTTLFNLICGSLGADSGAVKFDSKSILGLKPYQIASTGVSRTFQNIKMFPGMTALENVMVGLHTKSKAGFWAGMFPLPATRREEKKIRARAHELLELLDIDQFADIEASSLAFGQQRAVEFARALASDPTLLLLDEPAAGLNIYETAEVARLITKIQQQGITVLLVEHDMSLVMDISDEIVVLSFGQHIAEGTPGEIQHNKEVIQIYLGE